MTRNACVDGERGEGGGGGETIRAKKEEEKNKKAKEKEKRRRAEGGGTAPVHVSRESFLFALRADRSGHLHTHETVRELEVRNFFNKRGREGRIHPRGDSHSLIHHHHRFNTCPWTAAAVPLPRVCELLLQQGRKKDHEKGGRAEKQRGGERRKETRLYGRGGGQ